MKTSIKITKADNGWVVIRYENAIRAATSIATDATLLDVVREVAGISPLANVPQTVEEASESAFQPGDTVECVSALGDMRVGYKYTVESVDSFGWLRFYEIMGPDAAAQPAKYFCNPKRFRKVEPAPAPAPETDEEVAGERNAWDAWRLSSGPWQYVHRNTQCRFRATLRVAIEADRKKRGVGGVITREQFEDAYRMFALYPTNLREPVLNALATLGIMVED